MNSKVRDATFQKSKSSPGMARRLNVHTFTLNKVSTGLRGIQLTERRRGSRFSLLGNPTSHFAERQGTPRRVPSQHGAAALVHDVTSTPILHRIFNYHLLSEWSSV